VGSVCALWLALQAGAISRSESDSASARNTLSDQEQKDGWKLLFDGKTTNGWRVYKGDKMPEKWKVLDGVLVFDPNVEGSGGDIVTAEEYDNFEFVADWKISPGGNSGVMYHVTEDGEHPWQSGPEYQLLDNAGHADGRNPLTTAASCYALYAPAKDATKPVGDWNNMRLVVNGSHVEHWLNGLKVVEYDLGSDDWKKRVRQSKFNSMPNFARAAKGHIGLQDHGDRVEFRNLKIRPLSRSGDK
jgi:hypothetical protein